TEQQSGGQTVRTSQYGMTESGGLSISGCRCPICDQQTIQGPSAYQGEDNFPVDSHRCFLCEELVQPRVKTVQRPQWKNNGDTTKFHLVKPKTQLQSGTEFNESKS